MCNRYRNDEEMYVYDQCCRNCVLNGSINCPMYMDKTEDRITVIRENARRKKEDAVLRNNELEWCIYWKQKGRHR